MDFDSIVNILLIVLGFGLLIGIHELGHFLAAKWSGIRTNAFAIGMGPVVVSFRKGIGFCYRSTKEKVIAEYGKDASDMNDAELQKCGISETEYSLRLLPIGGFVSMLGQEDGKPDQVSGDPRSYNMCSIGKRMVVVSAGVIMNLLLAGVFFLICFQIGVNFESPVIGHIIPDSPAADASAIGREDEPLQSGDTVVFVDGKPATTFTDIQIAGAMTKPGVPIELSVRRVGEDELFLYSINPAKVNGLFELGLLPDSSLILRTGDTGRATAMTLPSESSSLNKLQLGMKMVLAEDEDVESWSQFDSIVQLSDGQPIKTKWQNDDETIEVLVPVYPELDVIRLVDVDNSLLQNYERGLIGLCPLTKISSILEDSPNQSVLQAGDVIVKAGSLEFPRMAQLRNFLTSQPDGNIDVGVLRQGKLVSVSANIHNGMLGVFLVDELNTPFVAQPLLDIVVNVAGDNETVPTPIASLQILGGTEIISINGCEVNDWSEIRNAIVDSSDLLVLKLRNPTKGHEISTLEADISIEEHLRISNLGWSTPLPSPMFEPLYVSRSSGGNPFRALQMGFEETVNMVVMTYLTIDRLLRRSVGVEQLRGPIGIVHIGSRIADRGISYLLFFLAIISVNLAVLNFLPLPIVDGGLFLYLIYEKIFKRPPSIAFQNAAAVLGLGLIATLFVVTFYNDIARLVV